MHNIRIYEKAYAKINLGLQIVSKRADGYHNIKSLMVPIDLYDELVFSAANGIDILCDCKELKNNNIVYPTAKVIRSMYNVMQGAKITLKKNIPIGGGLAGESSDAAATIRGLNTLWDLQLSQREMLQIAESIGSDVPYCLLQKPAIVEGKGNIIFPLENKINYTFILVVPSFASLTRNAFDNFAIIPENKRFNVLYDAIKHNNEENIKKALFNDFESKVSLQFENRGLSIDYIKEILIKNGCFGASLTGSGSTIYGLAKTIEQATQIMEKIQNEIQQCTFKIAKSI